MPTSFSVMCWLDIELGLKRLFEMNVKIWKYSCGPLPEVVDSCDAFSELGNSLCPWASWKELGLLNGFCRKIGTVFHLTLQGEVGCLSFSDSSQSIIVTWNFPLWLQMFHIFLKKKAPNRVECFHLKSFGNETLNKTSLESGTLNTSRIYLNIAYFNCPRS